MHRYDELENRWRIYNIKRNLRLYSLPIFVVLAGFVAYYYVFMVLNKNDQREQIAHISTPISQAHSSSSAAASSQIELAIKQESNQTEQLTVSETNLTNESGIAMYMPSQMEEEKNSTQQVRIIKDCYFVNTPILNVREKASTESPVVGKLKHGETICPLEIVGDWSRIENGWVFNRSLISLAEQPKESGAQTALKTRYTTPPPAQEQEKPAMVIEYKSIDLIKRIELMKERFSVGKDIKVAIELAEIYYDKKEYEEAKNWALTANEMDKNNEASWLLFAKSSYKQGNKEAAIKALRTYLSRVDSPNARTLLNDIEKEAF